MKTTTTPRDPQLAWILERAEASGVPVWLEAGTLLGVAREGGPLAHDRDIDIALWNEDAAGLHAIQDAARAAGYRIYRETHHGWMHKMKLFPPQRGARTIDLQIYRRTDTHAWSPIRLVPEHRYRWWALHRVAHGAMRWPLRWWWQEHARHVEITRWPWRAISRRWTWWIPLKLVAERAPHPGTGLPVPRAWEAYLEHRYGDWRRPDPSWDSERDDPTLRKAPPEALVGSEALRGPAPAAP